MAATLFQFAQVNDVVAATPSKLQKTAILGEYLRSLEESDLRLAVRFAEGRVFAATDERVLSVGGAMVWDIARAITGLSGDVLGQMIVRQGEIGEALAQVWPADLSAVLPADEQKENLLAAVQGSKRPIPSNSMEPLTLQDLSEAFDRIADARGVERKRAILLELFLRCRTGREAAYLTKIIFGDLRTGVQEGVLHAAIAKGSGKTLAQVRQCQFLVGDLDEVAVLARRDALEAARFRLFHPIQFMLATPQDSADIAAQTMAGRAYFADDKLDGIRAQVHRSGNRIAIFTRTMDRADESFPEVVEAMEKVPGDFLLDGEIVPLRDGKVLPFAHLQKRLGRKKISAQIRRDNPVAFIAFDILYQNGQLLVDCPLQDRRARLAKLAELAPSLLTVTQTQVSSSAEISIAFDAARSRRNEGIVLKDPQSQYMPGRRGQAWLKLKTHLPTIDCVVTAAEYGNGKRRNVLSDYTFAVWTTDPADLSARLVNVGKAYNGVTDAEIAQLTELFLSIAIASNGRVFAVQPKIVLEIACDQIQQSKRHESGYALRFPRIKRIRWDKRPEDADRLARVREIYESTHNFGYLADLSNPEPVEPMLFD
ncbi:MAG TPA: ATP-dependent DNA ligase [Tepidisphaeraceae bacterium]|nr:ATP-dependent DNA ligase [Tepidisphaeraceae bacterium]